MCLLTFMHEGVTADIDLLTNGAVNNPDGFGFAIHAGTKVIRHNGMHFDQVLERFLKERSIHSGPALFHSRITTHGTTNVQNCHPFQIGRDQQSVIAHNGMLPIKAAGGRSDTRILAEDLIPSWGGVTSFDGRKFRKKISAFAKGSKLVVITANPKTKDDFYIVNEQDGHWDGGVWWSNHSYSYSRSYTSLGYGYSSWSVSQPITSDDFLPTIHDASYIDVDGNKYEAEWWECYNCGSGEMVFDEEYDKMLFCPYCDSCWYCCEDRISCRCEHNKEEYEAYGRDYAYNRFDPVTKEYRF